jgi:hypothetical protein
MIKFNGLAFILAAAVLALPVTAAADPAPFARGERIMYSVKQMGVKAGDAVLEFKGDAYLDGKKLTLIVFTAKGFNFFDEERIYVDPVTFSPVKVLRDLNIFGNKENIMEEYPRDKGTIRVTRTADGKTTVKDIEPPSSGDGNARVDNIYGFLYRLRQGNPVKVGSRSELHLPTLNLMISGVKRVDFNAAGKKYNAVMLQSVPSKYTIWFDEGPQRLPLRIAGALGLSNTVMVMTGYQVHENP